MKKIILLTALCMQICLFGGILENGYKGAYCALTSSAKTYDFTKAGKNITNIGFSLNNKSGNSIYVQLTNGNKLQRFGQELTNAAELLLKDAVAESPIDISKDTELILYDTKTKKKILSAKFTPNKTIYINWNGKTLYKQQGPLGGMTGVNDNCYSLKNNVEDLDIAITR